jgi:hypothetical protein
MKVIRLGTGLTFFKQLAKKLLPLNESLGFVCHKEERSIKLKKLKKQLISILSLVWPIG